MEEVCEICKQFVDEYPIVLPCCGYEVCRKHLTSDSAKSESKSEEVCQICADPLNIEIVFKIKRNQIKIRKFEEDEKIKQLRNEYEMKIKKINTEFENLKKIREEIRTDQFYCADSLKKFKAIVDKRKKELLSYIKKQELRVIEEYDKLMTELEMHRVESIETFKMKVSEEIGLKSEEDSFEKNIDPIDKKLGKFKRIQDVLDISRKYYFKYLLDSDYSSSLSEHDYGSFDKSYEFNIETIKTDEKSDEIDIEKSNKNKSNFCDLDTIETIFGKLSIREISYEYLRFQSINKIKTDGTHIIKSIHSKCINLSNLYTGQIYRRYKFSCKIENVRF